MGDLGKMTVATSFECLLKLKKSPNLVTLVAVWNTRNLLISGSLQAAAE